MCSTKSNFLFDTRRIQTNAFNLTVTGTAHGVMRVCAAVVGLDDWASTKDLSNSLESCSPVPTLGDTVGRLSEDGHCVKQN